MIFSSTLFLFLFLPLTALLYYVVPRRFPRARNNVLLVASLAFYGWGEPVNIALMLLSICANYAAGLLVHRYRDDWPMKVAVTAGATGFNVGLLYIFKYLNFTVDGANILFGAGIELGHIALPIGISFFTFQSMSYVFDVYSGKAQPQRSLPSLALYIALFPQLIAGPIIRYADIEGQIAQRRADIEKIASGAQRFVVGLSKKVLIANQAAVFADLAFSGGSRTAAMAWAGAICYALQIYFDFSGYSDMAIGLGRMFGFEFPENFNYPYISSTVQEFWRRWHISLSSWFRDYLYIPLGGNRRGKARTYVNLMIVFLVTGLWHGANVTFVAWGLWHGVFLILERGAFGRLLKKLPTAATWAYTMLVVLSGWVLFRSDSIGGALTYLKNMFTFSSGGLTQALANIDALLAAAILAGIIGCAPIIPAIKKALYGSGSHFANENGSALGEAVSWAGIAASLVCLVMSVIFLSGSDFNPFLYFRF